MGLRSLVEDVRLRLMRMEDDGGRWEISVEALEEDGVATPKQARPASDEAMGQELTTTKQ